MLEDQGHVSGLLARFKPHPHPSRSSPQIGFMMQTHDNIKIKSFDKRRIGSRYLENQPCLYEV